MTRAAIYARTSTEEQREKQTIESQLFAARQYCQQHGLEIVETYEDAGVSGSVPLEQREAGARLLAAAEHGDFQSVVVYRLDRLSRDTLGCLLALKRLEALKAPVESVDEKFDDSPSGTFAKTVMMGVAALERDLIRQRTMAGRARRVRDGHWISSLTPYGYDRVDGHLVVNDEQAAVVRRLFDMVVNQGMGLNRIASVLNEEGVVLSRKPGRWKVLPTTVQKLLSAERFVGRATYGGEPMQSPRIIDDVTFSTARRILASRQVNARRNTKGTYLLQFKLICGHCGGRYQSKTVYGGRQLYLCRQRNVHGKLAGHEGIRWRWDALELDERIKAVIRDFVSDPEAASQTMEIYASGLEKMAGELEDRRAPLLAKLEELDAEEKRVLLWGRKEMIDEKTMLAQLAEVRAERADAAGKLKELEASATQPDPKEMLDALREFWLEIASATRALKERAAAKGVNLAIEWNEWTQEQWKAAVAHFVDRITVNDDGSLTVEGLVTANPASR